jgi:hypothetical protein
MKQLKLLRNVLMIGVACLLITGCATSINQITKWEKTGNVTKLSEVAQKKSEPAHIRKKSLESLTRLNWEPSNPERLQVYAMFASQQNYTEAASLLQTLSAEIFAEIDKAIVDCATLLTNAGHWQDRSVGRIKYNNLLSLDKKAVTISLCQQITARPKMQTRLVLLAIKLGITGSEDEIVAVLFEYGNKSMAEDYLNSGSGILAAGGRKWANSHGYNVNSGYGSNRAGWGSF